VSGATPVSLKHCALMREHVRTPRNLELKPSTRGQRRRRSLRRGIDCWHVDTLARVRTRRRVALIALTVEDPEPLAARGAIRAFWQDFRREFGNRLYFSWAELQYRGAVHYHAILVDPPWALRRHAVPWIMAHWPLASIQPSVEFRDWLWFADKGGAYVKAYAKDKWRSRRDGDGSRPTNAHTEKEEITVPVADRRGASDLTEANPSPRDRWDKSYQQDYDSLPREIRTWECSRLATSVGEALQHIDRWDIVNTNPFAPWPIRMNSYWLVGVVRHVRGRGNSCSLGKTKRPLQMLSGVGASLEDAGATTTSAPGGAKAPPVEPSIPGLSGPSEQLSTIPLPF